MARSNRETTVKGRLGGLLRFRAAMNANREELQHLEATRVRLDQVIDQIQEAADRQGVHTAGKQDASQQLRTLLTEGERLATLLRGGVKQHFGIRSEKLAEFGLQPFRGKARKADPATTETPTTPTPATEEPATPPVTLQTKTAP
jgi:hypothetical protein